MAEFDYHYFRNFVRPKTDEQVIQAWKNVCAKIQEATKEKSIDRWLLNFQCAVADEMQLRGLGNV